MYYYLYDAFLNSQRYQKVLNKIETRLTDLGVSGRICKMSILKDIRELVAQEYALGTRNFIAVGNDETLLKVINIVGDYDIVLGYIPVGTDNYLANLLGLLPEDLACDILSARIIRKIDLGKINSQYFLLNIKIFARDFVLLCDKSFRLHPMAPDCVVDIINLGYKALPAEYAKNINSQDGYLDVVITTPSKSILNFKRLFKKQFAQPTFVPVKEVVVEKPDNVKALADNWKTFKLPINITVCPSKLSMIVGKTRKVFLN